MRPLVLPMALTLALAGPGPLVAERPESQARAQVDQGGPAFDVRVTRGRARLARAEEVVSISAADGPCAGSGEATLGLGTAAEVEVAWRALASLRLTGPAEVEWGTDPEKGELELVVGGAAGLEIEARRATLRLELAHGWRLEVAQAAVQLTQEPHGGWIVRHHGGLDVRVRSRVPRERADWPRVLRPGDEIRLAARESGAILEKP